MEPFAGFELVQQGNFAFFCEEPTANRVIGLLFTEFEICETRKIAFQRNDPGGIILQKYSPFRERFVINFLWMKECGIFNKIYRHWNGFKLSCVSHGHYESVRIEYIASIFWIFIGAHGVAMCILISEAITNRMKKYRLKKIVRNGTIISKSKMSKNRAKRARDVSVLNESKYSESLK